ncbi:MULTISPECIES: hypothetical protein [unclassified Shinella]|uniref:hypothetical protein n=1 Tax=unclassified Shinella TaxID=2643062 RepID=UPI00234E53AA|nr:MULTISPECIES: hypothetical protein [unclassified Shinella]MCO5140868.1 hypothetical protein [Shinella sp.]MDC7256442.1 hypothetical protein [Shinella sp. YE25]
MSRLALSAILISVAVALPSPSLAVEGLESPTEPNLDNRTVTTQPHSKGENKKRLEPKVDTKKKRKIRQSNRSMSAKAERQARAEGQRIMDSHRPRLEREYRRRVARDGKASAERWLKKEAFALGARVGRQMKEKYAGQ